MPKTRVYELAKELGVDSKAVLTMAKDMGEFVKSPSSTLEAPVIRRLREKLAPSDAPASTSSAPAARPAAKPGPAATPLAPGAPRPGVPGARPGSAPSTRNAPATSAPSTRTPGPSAPATRTPATPSRDAAAAPRPQPDDRCEQAVDMGILRATQAQAVEA